MPVRTFGDWNDPPPGFVEVDFVAHYGPSSSGSFVQTLVLTDIATGWTECVPVVVRTGLAIELLVAAIALLPFPLRDVDFDNDGAFMNDPVVDWCRGPGLEVTGSRAYRKNDQDREIYSDDLGDGCGRVLETGRLRLGPRIHRSESPIGYSSAGCSPAEPASASPVADIIAQYRTVAVVQPRR